jgi:hypothetical protein
VIKSNDIFSLDAKHHKLTTLQKPINKGTAQVRVKIEHAFAGGIVKKKIQLKTYQILDRLMDIAVGLNNLRVTFRQIKNEP